MRALQRSLPLALAGLLLSLQSALAQAWTVEDGSQVRFTALQQGSPVEGGFDRFTADITFYPKDLGKSLVDVQIDTTSIDTGHKDRDTTLRSSAFFDVQRWPMARFRTLQLSHRKGDAYEATGRAHDPGRDQGRGAAVHADDWGGSGQAGPVAGRGQRRAHDLAARLWGRPGRLGLDQDDRRAGRDPHRNPGVARALSRR